MKPKLLLVDGLNLVRRIHAAVPNEDAEDLKRRCLGAMDKALRQHKPSHAILVWDGGHDNSWRRQLYPEYKAHRKPMPEDLARALPLLDTGFASLGVRSVRQQDLEADDLIATIASKVSAAGGEVVILSTDKGFGQLLGRGIAQWDHFDGHWIDAELLQQKVGVPQSRLLDYWALAGDSGNGIPGIPGIGKKTALELVSQFDSLKALFAADAVPGKLGERLQAHQDEARLSYRLVQLRRDLELKLNLSQFRVGSPT
ncbi:flap endonuclease Xni [Ferrimonas balearica]|uniref:flap endonuclease Xni n=1 Tax=Ferrimonas balearica TaxID=44012 RepID=UPI001C5860A6|nr:flap endonuclease Xni [Ferrimonas balearica]MBW3165020.1 flap endonuclease Xni [Ferrimonas balearica]MBY6106896.1 flap endonuclease Xni [Ferrimonas balearica]MBY6224547.1 flap endonuclease Xni [Ferrimonas balearica]